MATNKRGVVLLILVVLALLAGVGYMTRDRWLHPPAKKEEAPEPKECYTCPMHPQVIREKPGECPICGMSLVKKQVPVEGGAAPEAGKAAETAKLRTVSLDPRERMLANVATSEVDYGTISQDVYTVGKIAFNEKTLRRISARYPGRIERLDVNFTGQFVNKGQELFTIYSPELVETQKEYLIAKESAGRLKSLDFPEISKGTEGVLDSARTRMKLWGVTDAQMENLDKNGIVSTAVSVYSHVSGTVMEIKARQGDYVSEGAEIYAVADLSRIWVWAEVYEYEFPKVSLGSRAEVTAEAFPGRTFTGRVDFMDPTVNPESRTVRVRVDLPNSGGLLKPEMFVNARIFSRPVHGLMAPASAILYTGRGDIAWVEEEPGVFTMREVKVGMRSGDYFQVLSGLKAGDKVVTQGGFLIDSEAQLRASAGGAMAGMPGMEMGGEKGAPGPAPKGGPAPHPAPGKEQGGMKGMPGM